MKLFCEYLKSIYRLGITFVIVYALISAVFLLYRLPASALIYCLTLCTAVIVLYIISDFVRQKKRHEKLIKIRSMPLSSISDVLPEDNANDCDFKAIIVNLCSENSKLETDYNSKLSDMCDYYTVWAHQIKTPIASMRLTLQGEISPLCGKMASDLSRIEQYVEMVLTFLRLGSDSTDYIIKEYNLNTIVKQCVRKFSGDFIAKKIRLVYEVPDTPVITDEKWLSFVIEQLLSNALKYTREGYVKISISCDNVLCIKDTGIGIASEDLPRIFEKGYTGYNGRSDKKASGIGLYLCKRVCSNLRHKLYANSEVDKGTEVFLDLNRERITVE